MWSCDCKTEVKVFLLSFPSLSSTAVRKETELWCERTRQSLIDVISHWTPSVSSVQKARVLLVGAVGAGKTSFFTSLNSVFKGHVSFRANTGTAGTSLTTQFRMYSIKVNSKFLPLMLCDSMGLEEGLNAGLDIDDFTNILKGHIQDKYQFNPSVPLQPDSPYFCKTPTIKEQIHTVVYVMDACKVTLLSEKMIDKLAAFRRKANHMGIPQMVLLTKVDEACRAVGEDLKHVYQSHYIYKMMQEVSVRLGVSLSAVVPVKNYSKELELDLDIDLTLLNAVVQITRTSEAYFEEFPCEEE
ncbi:interferon induced protein 44c2 isoform X2 [Tachysurus fulvidraco]|uniref:interferon induced protein 44c2 isoform X2 n=1 Tax=Tachysurus fulvidraco TaxID=1234273 RepID=UPI001FED3D97|nr:interferon induced protein 44c2 isoform X2 [Tachysurus fulvidraco]